MSIKLKERPFAKAAADERLQLVCDFKKAFSKENVFNEIAFRSTGTPEVINDLLFEKIPVSCSHIKNVIKSDRSSVRFQL